MKARSTDGRSGYLNGHITILTEPIATGDSAVFLLRRNVERDCFVFIVEQGEA